MIKKTIYLIIIFAAVATGLFFAFRRGESAKSIDVQQGRINEVKAMVKLCTMDLYREVPVTDTINKKVIFAIQKQRGSISFDIEKIKINDTGDTVRMTLPPEIVEINESTDDNSWQVIDTKNISFLGFIKSDRLSDAEENQVKAKLRRNSIKSLYANGTVKRARNEAAANLRTLMENIYRKPVIIEDPAPGGSQH